jgi:hypothetical protein
VSAQGAGSSSGNGSSKPNEDCGNLGGQRYLSSHRRNASGFRINHGKEQKIMRGEEDWRAASLSKASKQKMQVAVWGILATRLEILLEATIGSYSLKKRNRAQ